MFDRLVTDATEPFAVRMALCTIILFLLAACGPPSQRDSENYSDLQLVLPAEWMSAPVERSWRAFGSFSEGGTTQQCAVIVYDTSGLPIEPFATSIAASSEAGHMGPNVMLADWRLVGDVLPPPADYEREAEEGWERAILTGQYDLFPGNRYFCDMDAENYAALAAEVLPLWRTPGTPVLAHAYGYGGGLDLRKTRHIYAVVDARRQKLHTWMYVSPGNM